jgi:hypothetical protein
MQIDFQKARSVNPIQDQHPNIKELPLAPLPRAGFNLAKMLLYIIGGYMLFLIVLFTFNTFDASKQITELSGNITNDTVFSQRLELIKLVQEEKKNFRDLVLQLSQMILLNLLLPVLTAILGYIFGSKEDRRATE